MSQDQLSKDWQASLKAAYQPIQAQTKSAVDYAKLVIGSKGLGNDLNVSPAISPDGKQLVFLSSRGLFSIDLYLADVATGKIERQLVKTAVNPHFNSLEFIYSAGAWSGDGRQFVFSAVSDGQPELVLVDMQRKAIDREIKFAKLGEIFNPAWSPDGRSIAFSATSGGQSDLYVYDVKAGQAEAVDRRLVRRSAARVGSRRTQARVCHRPVQHRSHHPQDRQLPPRPH